jgi:hypothetical protein
MIPNIPGKCKTLETVKELVVVRGCGEEEID